MRCTQLLKQAVDILKKSGLDPFPDELLPLYEYELSRLVQPSPPLKPCESAVVACHESDKIAALCFDRVWGAADENIDFSLNSIAEVFLIIQYANITLIAELKSRNANPDIIKYINENIAKVERAIAIAYLREFVIQSPGQRTTVGEVRGELESDSLRVRFRAQMLSSAAKRSVLPVYFGAKSAEKAYSRGDTKVVIALLSDIAIPSNKDLTWEQVGEFRRDRLNREKYRKLLHFMDGEMVGKPLSFIHDELAFRLSDYEFSLRKHGIRTVTGALGSMMDWKHLTSGSLVGSVASITSGSPTIGVLSGAGLLIGRAALSIVETRLKLDEVKRGPGSEVAFIHEAKKIHKKASKTFKRM